MTKPTPLRVVNDPATGDADDLAAPPHNLQAEQCVLGAVMLSPAALAEVRPLLDTADFYRPAHQQIWDTICGLADRGAPFDPLAVGAELGTTGLAKVGGAPYLHTLITQVPAAAGASYFAQLLRDAAYARTVVVTGSRLLQLGTRAMDDGTADLRSAVTGELAQLTQPDSRGWPEPSPLTAVAEPPEFPVWCLPGWLGEYVAALAEQTQTPPDLAGCLALSVLAVAASGRLWVQATWTEPLCLYMVIALGPGNRKSEVYAAMTAPITAAEKAMASAAQPLVRDAEMELRIAQADAEKAERAAMDATDPLARDEFMSEASAAAQRAAEIDVPAVPKLFTDDFTMEALTSLIAEQGGRCAVLSPEGDVFDIAAGRYSGTPNLATLKKGHAGEPIRVTRKTRDEHIDHATLTLAICTQPDVLTGLADTKEFRGQGLLGRILYSVPKSLLGYRQSRPALIPDHVQSAYTTNLTALINSLDKLPTNAHTAEQDPRPKLTFTPEGREAVFALLDDTEPRFRPDGDLGHMTDWGGKYVGAVLRIAALLHLAQHLRDGFGRPIEKTTLTDAIALGEYFISHAQAAYDAIGADPAVNAARAVLDWARTTTTTRFTARDLLTSLRRFKKVTDTDPALNLLETHGWIRRLPTPPRTGRGRPAAPTYEVNPTVHQPTT